MAWTHTVTYASGTTILLPTEKQVADGDFVRLTVITSSQQSLDYTVGQDFTLVPPRTISFSLSDIPVVAGDTVLIVNYFRNLGTTPTTGTITSRLIARRDSILAQLAAMDSMSLGGRPNVAMDIGPDHVGAVDHVGYRDSLYRELEKLKQLIHDYSDPWEIRS